MNPVKRTTATLLVAAIAVTCGFSSAASARVGDRTLPEVYPLASKLCTEVAKGAPPKRLRPSVAAVLADCAALESNFNTAHAALLAGRASLASTFAVQNTATKAACAGAAADTTTCIQARRARHHLAVLTQQARAALDVTYVHALEAGRHTFWKAIHALPGEHNVHADKPVTPESS